MQKDRRHLRHSGRPPWYQLPASPHPLALPSDAANPADIQRNAAWLATPGFETN